ncbi:MAG: glycosyltransferase [Verrucomicrobiota bacterium]
MNVTALTTCSRKAGGLFYSVRWLSKALARQGCRMKVFSPPDEYSQQDVSMWDPVPVEFYPAFGPLQTSPRLRSMLARSGADLVHVHGIWLDSQWAAMQHQKKNNIPVVVSPRGMLDPWAIGNSAWKKRWVGKLFARRALEQATCIHALCRSEAESIRAYGLKTPIAVIPNGVELPALQTSSGETPVRRNSRESAHAVSASSKKQLLFLGRIHPKKGLEQLLRAWAKNPGSWRGEWELLIAGWDDGGHEQGFKDFAAKLGIESSVSFVGPQYGDEKEALLRSVNAFILPSFSEGLPMSVLEAWSFGLPVVMTDFCNIPEGFGANAAIRIEPDSESIADGLLMLMDMADDNLETMGLNGRKLVEQEFTWSGIAEKMQQVYDWCLTGTNPPECMEF